MRNWLRKENAAEFNIMCIPINDKKVFRFWQAGGGFDRNLWNTDALHSSIAYIENNPVRTGLAASPENWLWSSAHARKYGTGLVPDDSDIPVLML